MNRPREKESTALGAVYLCALGLNLIKKEDISALRECEKFFEPKYDEVKYEKLYDGWKRAVGRCLHD